jgi:hypothetical protein
MTSLTLILWIVLGIAVQAALYLSIVFWKHWQAYQALRLQAVDLAIAPPQTLPGDEAVTPSSIGWPGLRAFRVERKVIEDIDRSVCSFYLVPEDRRPLPAFRPGQFLTFHLQVPATGGGTEPLVRCYSLSGAPAQDHYRISVKRVPAAPGQRIAPGRSSNHLHDRVEVGDVLQLRAPAGHFYLDAGESPVVLIAGGIGITPLLSMLDWCLAEQPGREVWLFYGVRNSRELVMLSHLEAQAATHAGFRLRLCFSDPLPADLIDDPSRVRGRVDVGQLRMQLPLKPYHYYLCGPASMLQSLVPALEDWGVPEAHIHYEAFGPASIQHRKATAETVAVRSADGEISVSFARSGKRLAWQPQYRSLLELAEANGVPVASGCRAGGCGTCQTTIGSGEVAYLQAPDFDPEPGTCLLCVCAPKTSVTLEA